LHPAQAVLHASVRLPGSPDAAGGGGGGALSVHAAVEVRALRLCLDPAQVAGAAALLDRLAWAVARNAHAPLRPAGWAGRRGVRWR
jgi:hypothetical protein